MRYALSGSALVHAGVFGTALLGFAWPQPEDAPAPGAVTVDIITMESVSTNTSATLETATATNLVSAGAEPVKSQTVEPLEPETLAPAEPVRSATMSQTIQPMVPSTAPVATSMLLGTPVEAIETASVAPLPPIEPEAIAAEPMVSSPDQPIAPVSAEDLSAAPVPHTLSFTRPSKPTPRDAAPRRPATPPAQVAGNGGANDADAAATKAAAGQQDGAGGGGAAEMAPWERQVRRKLAGAQRYPRAANGASGDVVVRFTVSSGGSLSGLRVIASSGNPLLDQAALDTVARAAPFPPIPAGAGVASTDLAIPLGFVR